MDEFFKIEVDGFITEDKFPDYASAFDRAKRIIFSSASTRVIILRAIEYIEVETKVIPRKLVSPPQESQRN